MFKHILLPTDGSKLALKGVKAGVKLAKALGARVTGVYVVSPYLPRVGRGRARVRLSHRRGRLRSSDHSRTGVVRE